MSIHDMVWKSTSTCDVTFVDCLNTVIEPPLQIHHLLDFCWTQILTFCPGFFANQCAFTVVWSPYFFFKISGPQTIAVAREQFWPHLCKNVTSMSHAATLPDWSSDRHDRARILLTCQAESEFAQGSLAYCHAFWSTSSIRICLLITAPFLLKFGF